MGRFVSLAVLGVLLGLTRPVPSPACLVDSWSYGTPLASLHLTGSTGSTTLTLTSLADALVPYVVSGRAFVIGLTGFFDGATSNPVTEWEYTREVGAHIVGISQISVTGAAWGLDSDFLGVNSILGGLGIGLRTSPLFTGLPTFPLTDVPTSSAPTDPGSSLVFPQGTSLEDPHDSLQSVPEPSTLLLLASGLGVVGTAARRRRRPRPQSL